MSGATVSSRVSSYNKKIWSLAFLVALVTVLVYIPALQNNFVNWDDPIVVYENPQIQSIDFGFVKWMFSFQLSNWTPLLWLSHAIDYALWGLNPMGHHLTSIIFHGLNTFLVVILIARLLHYKPKKISLPSSRSEQYPVSLFAASVIALLFGLHPIHVESVVWVTARGDVLYASFFLMSILMYLKYTSCSQKQKHLNYFLCLSFFILSLMSKSMAVTLPLVLLILDVYPLKRLNLKSDFISERKVLIEKIPFLVLSIASSVMAIMAKQSMEAIIPLGERPLLERFWIPIKALCFYLFKMVWPTGLAPLYPYPLQISFLSIEYISSLILILCITAFCIWSWKRQKVFLAVWAYYIVTLLPVLGIIQVGEQAAADRYTYLPSLGIFFLFGLGVLYLWERADNKRNIKLFISVLLTIIFFVLSVNTMKQISIWTDSITLWTYEIKKYPDNEIAYINRGRAYLDELEENQKALTDLNMAIKLNPQAKDAYYNRAIAYQRLGHYQQAIRDCTIAIKIDRKFIKAYINRGVFYGIVGDYQKSIKDLTIAIEYEPQNSQAFYNRGFSYSNLGSYQKALQDYNSAINLNTQYVEAYKSRGNIYLELGHFQNAIKDYQTAAQLGDKNAQDYLQSKGIVW